MPGQEPRLHGWWGGVVAAVGAVRTNPTLAAVSTEAFLTRFGFGMVGFALPLYALALGMNLAEIGLLYSLRTGTTVLIKPVMGRAADHFGQKPVLVVAVVLRCLVGLLLVFATQPWELFLVRFLQGAVTAAREPSATALIAEHGDRRRMASAFAWYSTWRELGHSLGIGAAGLVIGFYGSYSSVFLIAFFMSCAGLVTVARYVREHPAADPEDMTQTAAVRGDRPKAGSWALYRPLIPYAAFGMMVAGTAEMVKGLFPVIATQYANLSVAEAGFAASASSLAFLVAGPFFGWLSDHVSRRLALGARSLANTVSSVLYVLFPSFAGVLIARVVDDTGKVAFKPTWGAVLAEVSEADPARRGRTIAFVDSAYTLGEVLGPLAAGLLMAWFGIPVMLGVRAAIGLIAELQAVLLFRKPSPPVRSLAQGELR